MKRVYAFILIALVTVLSSCEKDKIIDNDKMVGISRITYYPTFEITGESIVSIVKGTAFTDPGVKATAGGAEVPVTTGGSVDINTVGLYTLSYSATNADGYSASATRVVVVIPSAELSGVDLSGTYAAVPVGTTPGPATISKVAPGVYFTTNCWGNSGAVIPAYFICVDGSTVIVPFQPSPYGNLESTEDGTYSGGLITWSINLIDQGNFIRVKKWQK